MNNKRKITNYRDWLLNILMVNTYYYNNISIELKFASFIIANYIISKHFEMTHLFRLQISLLLSISIQYHLLSLFSILFPSISPSSQQTNKGFLFPSIFILIGWTIPTNISLVHWKLPLFSFIIHFPSFSIHNHPRVCPFHSILSQQLFFYNIHYDWKRYNKTRYKIWSHWTTWKWYLYETIHFQCITSSIVGSVYKVRDLQTGTYFGMICKNKVNSMLWKRSESLKETLTVCTIL